MGVLLMWSGVGWVAGWCEVPRWERRLSSPAMLFRPSRQTAHGRGQLGERERVRVAGRQADRRESPSSRRRGPSNRLGSKPFCSLAIDRGRLDERLLTVTVRAMQCRARY
ncbi:hypothetical protein C8Q73DRAFT_438989 [Cubamyces lactineus]|nr:hypothetical protein C8Q73DRAFT_438989 [Cubamyces lactineus]